MTEISLIDRYYGAMLGLACGDAVGCSVEFIPRDRFTPRTEMTGGGKFRLNPGEWTDDTSMALCLASSLCEQKGHDPEDQMARYSHWFSTGDPGPKSRPIGVGKTVLNALFKFRRDGIYYAGSSDPRTAGNGALMRLAPVVLAYFPNLENIQKYAKLSTLTTHAAEACIQTTALFAEALYLALTGSRKEEIEAIHEEWADLKFTSPNEIKGIGYAPESLRAAMWAFLSTDSLEQAILAAVNLGDDADTTAAICGQIAGAFYGVNAIPKKWLSILYMKNDIATLADDLLALSRHQL
jgi:ADP-ribosyl-[dinitrogen reductase] hydrolase